MKKQIKLWGRFPFAGFIPGSLLYIVKREESWRGTL